MTYPTLAGINHHDAPAGGRVYELSDRAQLFALWYPGPLPTADAGAFLYVFFSGRKVGSWNWARDAEGLRSIIEAHERSMDPLYTPPSRLSPAGEFPDISPTDEDMLARAIAAARPDFIEPRPSLHLTLHTFEE